MTSDKASEKVSDMERRNYHVEGGIGILAAPDGTTTEVGYDLARYEGKLGSRWRPVWTPWLDVTELDFRKSKVNAATMAKKGRLSLKLKDGSEITFEWDEVELIRE